MGYAQQAACPRRSYKQCPDIIWLARRNKREEAQDLSPTGWMKTLQQDANTSACTAGQQGSQGTPRYSSAHFSTHFAGFTQHSGRVHRKHHATGRPLHKGATKLQTEVRTHEGVKGSSRPVTWRAGATSGNATWRTALFTEYNCENARRIGTIFLEEGESAENWNIIMINQKKTTC